RFRQHAPAVVNHTDGDLCPPNVHRANHKSSPRRKRHAPVAAADRGGRLFSAHYTPFVGGNNPDSSSTTNEQSRNVSGSTPESRANRSATNCAGIISIKNCHSLGISGTWK